MTQVLWQAEAVAPTVRGSVPALSPAARRVIDAVRAGAASPLFPPVLRLGEDGLLAHDRDLAGEPDAALLTAALTDPRFAPLDTLLDALDAWCGRTAAQHTTLLAPGVLDVTDGALFGPLVCEAFTACAAGVPYDAEEECARWTGFLDRFLQRLARDTGTPWFDQLDLRLPVTGIEAQGAETHNGRRRVLRVRLGGGSIAYKPRPASGEVLFLPPDDSVFALLNALPSASGPVRLPVLRCTPGSGPDGREYSWQEWLEPPTQWGVIRTGNGRRLHGTRLGRRQAERYWHRAGSLAAAAFRFGIADLGEGNLLVGTRPQDREPLPYPVDLEIFLTPLQRLHDTGLIADEAAGDHHHPGFEDRPRWCTVDGPVTHFTETADGGPRLVRRDRPCTRGGTRTVVADTHGRTGHGPYLPSFLRGMFDAWTLMSRHHDRIRAHLQRAAPDTYVRVLLKPTAAYTEALADRLTGAGTRAGAPSPDRPGGTPATVPQEVAGATAEAVHGALAEPVFGPAETAQLDVGDVPYFFRRAHGGPLLRTADPAHRPSPAAHLTVPADPDPAWPPSAAVLDERGRDLAGLGVALRDAVEYAFATAGPGTLEGDGVRVRVTDRHTGEAEFTWAEAGRRITYTWDLERVRIRVEPFTRPEPVPDVRRRLLRMDRVDAVLRARWVASGFTDEATEKRLVALTTAGMGWLADVVARYGWPGHALVGPAAAAAACRLLQHAEGPIAFQQECLRLIQRAAREGDLPRRQVAYVTDALRVGQGRPQVYGTKFRLREGELEPCPIEQPDRVDELRRNLGMEPLARYAGRLRSRYRTRTR
ncbi:DUF4135 domain-containing protein [Streptomyces olivaceoviridis]|uniref:DUF4135 domain-containing protein n=1 Tax=Streptomyces olivaceoviridis TaxID=1921 RepID=UPI00339E0ABD